MHNSKAISKYVCVPVTILVLSCTGTVGTVEYGWFVGDKMLAVICVLPSSLAVTETVAVIKTAAITVQTAIALSNFLKSVIS